MAQGWLLCGFISWFREIRAGSKHQRSSLSPEKDETKLEELYQLASAEESHDKTLAILDTSIMIIPGLRVDHLSLLELVDSQLLAEASLLEARKSGQAGQRKVTWHP